MSSDRRVWLVRHGETEGQSSIRFHGANDVPLSDVGRAQIRDLVPLLGGAHFSRVLHSPLSRATESTQILVDALAQEGGASDLTTSTDERLREISFGACEGMTREEIDDAYPSFWSDYEAGKLDAFPLGEARSAFAARVTSVIEDLVVDDWHGDALLVAHRGTVKHAICSLLGEPDAPRGKYGVDLGSLSVLRHSGVGWQIELLSMRP